MVVLFGLAAAAILGRGRGRKAAGKTQA